MGVLVRCFLLPYGTYIKVFKLETNNLFNLFELSKYKSFTLNYKHYLKIIGNFLLSRYEIEEMYMLIHTNNNNIIYTLLKRRIK